MTPSRKQPQKSQIPLVVRRDGRRHLHVRNLVLSALLLAGGLGGGIAVIFRLLAGRWSHYPFMYGAFLGLGMVLVGLLGGLMTKLERLPERNGP